jgi:NaMN:DMB phosphoribosyltransferase
LRLAPPELEAVAWPVGVQAPGVSVAPEAATAVVAEAADVAEEAVPVVVDAGGTAISVVKGTGGTGVSVPDCAAAVAPAAISMAPAKSSVRVKSPDRFIPLLRAKSI